LNFEPYTLIAHHSPLTTRPSAAGHPWMKDRNQDQLRQWGLQYLSHNPGMPLPANRPRANVILAYP